MIRLPVVSNVFIDLPMPSRYRVNYTKIEKKMLFVNLLQICQCLLLSYIDSRFRALCTKPWINIFIVANSQLAINLFGDLLSCMRPLEQFTSL